MGKFISTTIKDDGDVLGWEVGGVDVEMSDEERMRVGRGVRSWGLRFTIIISQRYLLARRSRTIYTPSIYQHANDVPRQGANSRLSKSTSTSKTNTSTKYSPPSIDTHTHTHTHKTKPNHTSETVKSSNCGQFPNPTRILTNPNPLRIPRHPIIQHKQHMPPRRTNGALTVQIFP